MGTSWIDFYNQLTASSKATSQTRKENFFRLDYGADRGGANTAVSSKKSASKSTRFNDAIGPLKYLSPIVGIIDDAMSGDDKTPGMRVLDVMARGNYTSAAFSKSLATRDKSKSDISAFPAAFAAAGRGFTGKDKDTYASVFEAKGEEQDTILEGIRNFGLDVILDPTTYIGPGVIKGAFSGLRKGAGVLKGVKGVDKAAEFAKDGLVPQPKAIEGITKATPTQAVPDNVFENFIRDVTRNSEKPGEPSIFDNIIDQQGNPVTPVRPIPNDPRYFNVDPKGTAKETLQIAGPPLEVVAARTSLSRANELAARVPKFTYNREALEKVPEWGPFNIEKVPANYTEQTVKLAGEDITLPPKDQWMGIDEALYGEDELRAMEGDAEIIRARELAEGARAEKAKKLARYKHLADNGDKDLENFGPVTRTIMSAVDEPVYAAYAPQTKEFTNEAGRKVKIKVWLPTQEAINNKQVMDMGRIRELLSDKPLTRDEVKALIDEGNNPATPLERKREIKARLERKPVSEAKRKQLMQMLANHVRAVEDWVKSGPAGYNSPAGYTNLYRELYGAAPKDYAKGAKAVSAAREKSAARLDDLGDVDEVTPVGDELPDIPKSPFEDDLPDYDEILVYSNLSPAEKKAWLEQYIGTSVSPAHLTYLAQAHNPASFETRLTKLLNLNESYADDIEDVANAIANKQLLDVTEEGVPELLKHYNVKTLPALEKAIRKDLVAIERKVDKMLGANRKINEAAPLKQVPDQPKELGPTGLPYRPYEARLQRQVKQAKEKAVKATAKAEVKPTEEIIKDVVAGNKVDLVQPKVTFNSSQRQMFENALGWAVHANVIEPRDTELWAWVTRTGVKRTSPTMNKGKGRVKDAWNLYSQYDFFRGLMMDAPKVDEGVKNALNQLGVKGTDRLAARADYMYGLLMEPMRAMDEMLKAGGIFPVAGTRQYDTPFSFYDAFISLPPEFVKKNIFTLANNKQYGKASRIAPTQLMQVLDIGVASFKNAMNHVEATDDIADLIKLALLEKQVTRGGKAIPNYMPHLAKNRPEELDEIVDQIVDAIPELLQKVEVNQAARKLWHENKRFEGTQAALDTIAERVMSPDYNIPEAMKLSNEVDPTIKAISRSKGIDADDEFMVRAEVNAAAPSFPGLNAETRAEAKRAHLRSTTKTKKQQTKIDVDAMAESTEQATKITEELGIPLRDLESKFEASVLHRMISAIFPHWGNEVLRPMFLSKSSAAQTLARTYQGLVGKITQTYTKETIDTAWKELQVGRWSADESIRAAQTDINKAIGVMFDDDSRYALFNRQGLNASELNAHFEHYKIHPKFHFENDEVMHNAWRTWDTNDPMDLLAKMFAATQKTMGKKLLGDQLMLEFGSLTKKPGYIKIAPRGNEILRYIDADTYYFPRDIASQMRILDEFLRIDMKPTYAGTGASALRIYDSALHAYKSGLTIYRPGHHMRNMVGDVWLSFMAGVTDPTVYKDALRVMRQMQGRYSDFDAVKALAAGDEVKFDASDAIIAYTKVNGKRVGLTAGQIYRGMYDHGVLPDYRTLEDLQIGTEGSFSMPKVFGGRVHKVAATVSQSRDHYIRLAHGIDVLKKGNFKNLEDAMEATSHTVRKWHPDGSDLTHFERKAMRRTFMFYSWIRKAIPLILEGMVMRPGRAMVYPKAMYNLAIANGIDVDSLGNPFPTDQLFPDYLTESLQGPFMQDDDGHYMGIQPGIPMLDVLGDYGGNDPGRVIMGSTTPLMKVPWEMATGPDGAIARDVRTDVPVFDKSDYLDKQIPNSNLFINSTGNSLTQPWESKGGAERDFQPDTQSAWINFLMGAGLIDMSRPGTILQGKRDNGQRNR